MNRLLVCAVLLLAGCATRTPAPPAQLRLEIGASENLNPDANGRSSPIVVRVFQLTESDALNAAQFFDAYDNEQATLGASVLWRKEIILAPGQQIEISTDRVNGATALAALAAFRDVRNATWKDSAPLTRTSENEEEEIDFAVTLAGKSIAVELVEKEEAGWFKSLFD